MHMLLQVHLVYSIFSILFYRLSPYIHLPNAHLSLQCSTHMAQVFSIEDVTHMLVPRSGVINSYVVQVRGEEREELLWLTVNFSMRLLNRA